MIYSKEFFALNLQFAQQVALVLQQPIEEALLRYTHLYLRLGLGRSFNSENPLWQTFLTGLQQSQDGVAWSYTFYLRQQEKHPPTLPEPNFGCFSYALWSEDRVRLHFHNGEEQSGEGDAYSPLDARRLPIRKAELTEMFTHLKALVPATAIVVGGSWLYNLVAYQQLFPPIFIQDAQIGQDEFQYIALWGQFLDRHGRVRENLAVPFLEKLKAQSTLAGLQASFPFQVLRVVAPISAFYVYYGVL
jgi:hypothetical protein